GRTGAGRIPCLLSVRQQACGLRPLGLVGRARRPRSAGKIHHGSVPPAVALAGIAASAIAPDMGRPRTVARTGRLGRTAHASPARAVADRLRATAVSVPAGAWSDVLVRSHR